MSRNRAASSAIFRALFACGLCLLAFVFAVEAKTAWYGPQGGLGSAVCAAKAFPADAPEAVPHGVPTPDPVHPGSAFFVLAAFEAALSAVPERWADQNLPRRDFAGLFAAFFSPELFFRPPPGL